jgi:mannose-6-phosphate isomerase-like protein (cupin superfamily)
MEPIHITLKPGGRSVEYAPHEGEVFGYVLNGTVILNVGNRKWKIKKSECFYYPAGAPYFIENTSSHEAAVLWVTSPPNF